VRTRDRLLTIFSMHLSTGFAVGGVWASLRYAPEANLSPLAAGAIAFTAVVLGGATPGLVVWANVAQPGRAVVIEAPGRERLFPDAP